MSLKLLLFGKTGQVGLDLLSVLPKIGTVVAFSKSECNIVDGEKLKIIFDRECPDIVVNAVAYTHVDQAEEDRENCYNVNATAVKQLATLCKDKNILLVHYSTDYIFDGDKTTAWKEEDQPNPLNVYGASKLQGENHIIASGCPYLILRTSWVYSLQGRNFLLTILRLAKEKEELKIVDDQFGAPTWSRTIAENTCVLLKKIIAGNALNSTKDVLNLASTGSTNWWGFARAIVSMAKHKQKLKIGDETKVLAIPSSSYPQKAKRPLFSVLSTDKIRTKYAVELPSWEKALKSCMSELGP